MAIAIPTQVKKLLVEEIKREMQTGIRFAVAGNRGFGKTSTVNALFNVDMPTSASKPTTTDIHEVTLQIEDAKPLSNYPTEGIEDVKFNQYITLQIYDLPGLGDGIAKNKEKYFSWYELMFKNIDAILWVLRADVSAFQQDIDYISQLMVRVPDIASRIIIGLNRADAIEPNNWNFRINQPSLQQQQELIIVREQALKLVHDQCGITSNIVTYYSAKQSWRLETLFNYLTGVVPEGRKWVFGSLKRNYREAYLAHVDVEFREQVANMYDKIINSN